MKILEVCRSYFPSVGGLENYVFARTKVYESLNIDYKILATNFTTEKVDNLQKHEKVTYLKQYTPYNFAPDFDQKIYREADIISVNQVGNYLSDKSINTASKLKKKIILTPHLYFHTKRFSGLKKFHERFFLRNLLIKTDKIVCFTDYEITFWRENFEMPRSKFVKIPHYFDSVAGINIENKITNEPFILYIGRNFENKRIDLLIKAFACCNEINLNLYLTVEEKDLSKELKDISKSDKRIKFLGYISDQKKEELLKNCKALILPSDYEAFGIVCFEASKYSKPLLCSHLSTLHEILNPGGVFFFDNNINSIEEKLRELNQAPESKLKEMGKINKNNLGGFSFEKNIELYKSLFKEIVKDL
jgi:glycosyltransferase involved in cell wall biosynthesis